MCETCLALACRGFRLCAAAWWRGGKVVGVLLGLLGLSLPGLAGADWPQWRGPTRDGLISDFAPPATWPETLTARWSLPVGKGHSSPVVAGGRVFCLMREGTDEVVRCLRLDDGAEVWRQAYPAPVQLDPVVGRYADSPRATPAVAQGVLLTLGVAGTLTAWEAATGKQLWQQTFAENYKPPFAEFGSAASPLVVGKAGFAQIGGKDHGAVIAFEVTTGKQRWAVPTDGPGYASPMLHPLDGHEVLVMQTQGTLLGLTLDGQTRFKLPFETAYRQNAITTVAHDNLLFYSGYQLPLTAARVRVPADKLPATLTTVWENKDLPLYLSTPVWHEGLLFGMTQRSVGKVFCVEAATGATKWTSPGRMGENVSLQVAGDLLLLLSDRGVLTIAKAHAASYDVLAHYSLGKGMTIAHPVPVGNRLLLKDETTLTCWGW